MFNSQVTGAKPLQVQCDPAVDVTSWLMQAEDEGRTEPTSSTEATDAAVEGAEVAIEAASE